MTVLLQPYKFQIEHLHNFQMWNLFATVEPKVILPARSLKEDLLQQQQKKLISIEEQLNKIINSINSLLKPDPNHFSTPEHVENSLICELEQTVSSLSTSIQTDNTKFQDFITYRDQQKTNHQEFFRNALKHYEHKKYELNKYIQELQHKVQALQLQGFKTYESNPKPNGVISGFNQAHLEKYVTKLEELKKIEQGIQSFVTKHKINNIKLHPVHSSPEFAHAKQSKQSKPLLFESDMKCGSLSDLEKELEMILLKEEIKGQMLDKRIKQCKINFQELAHKENSLKESIKKMAFAGEEKRRLSARAFKSLRGLSQINELTSQTMKKASSFLSVDSKVMPIKGPSIIYNMQPEIEIENEQQQSDNEQQEGEDESSQQIPSQNFIEACEFLITERFIGEEDEKDQEICEGE